MPICRDVRIPYGPLGSTVFSRNRRAPLRRGPLLAKPLEPSVLRLVLIDRLGRLDEVVDGRQLVPVGAEIYPVIRSPAPGQLAPKITKFHRASVCRFSNRVQHARSRPASCSASDDRRASYERLRAVARPPFRPVAFFCAVVPP